MNIIKIKEKQKSFKARIFQITSWILFCIYAVFLVWRLYFYAYGNYYRANNPTIDFNIIPFRTIINFLKSFSFYNFNVWFFNLFGNVIAFTPLGFFLPIIIKKVNSIKKIFYTSCLTSLTVEILQLLSRLGTFDIDDIILNTLGSILGFILVRSLSKRYFS